ncbi:MAG TPA: NAD(P)-binding domain-containing protein, partial [Pseudonocardiaceae bacterium]|nr:NAD(P)-binding domain-containing protein [Pseudonocardiaceae bacterium]
AAGARWTTDLAGCAVVFTVLPGVPELTELVLGSGQFLSHLDKATTWVDLTSGSFEAAQDFARAAREHGIAYLDAPIGGGVPAMRAGTVRLYVGGDAPRWPASNRYCAPSPKPFNTWADRAAAT